MAETTLADIVEPALWLDYDAENNPEKTAFVEGGIAMRNPVLDAALEGGSKIGTIPFWLDLDPDEEPNYSDDTENLGASGEVTADDLVFRKAYLNKIYKVKDLVKEIAGSDPMERIKDRFGTYWMRAWQRRVIATCEGILANNVANDSSDMVNDIHGALNSDVNANTLFSQEAMVNAIFTAGDRFDDYTVIAVHSMVYKRMVKNNDIEFIKQSDGTTLIPFFMGRRVIIDDGLPVTAAAGLNPGDAAAQYTSILYGMGAIGYGMNTPDIPVETFREPTKGNGAGAESIIERVNWLIHPAGHKFNSVSIGTTSATLAELAEAQQWTRVYARKNVPMAFLITNG